MDKFEYQVRADEIRALIAKQDYAQAAEIADTIDWRRVKSVMMLCTISDLYKINKRYEDAKNMLLLAYERRPGGRTICYSLCELCVKTGEFGQAVNFYKEFVQVAPKDPGRYILQYKLYEAQDVSLEERITVLEELKQRDYREKWAYELAYLYHRVGMATRCVEECDELILWFGDGKYVVKAMELKMLHQPLSPEQQEQYDHRFDRYQQDVQEETAQSQEEVVENNVEPAGENLTDGEAPKTDEQLNESEQETAEVNPETASEEEMDIQVKTVDVGQYNTINLQAELAAGLQEVLGTHKSDDTVLTPMVEAEVFFGETGEIEDMQSESPVSGDTQDLVELTVEEDEPEPEAEEVQERQEVPVEVAQTREEPATVAETERSEEQPVAIDETAEVVMEQMRLESVSTAEEQVLIAQPPRELAGVLSQESDGQISLVIPESEKIEKQITGQINIEDILAEWERMKKQNEEKRKEEVRQHVLQQTGTMFTEFEAAARDGLLEKLESGAAIVTEANVEEVQADEVEAAEEPVVIEETEAAGEPEEIEEPEEAEEIEEPEEPEEPEAAGEPEEIEEPEEAEEPEVAEEPEEIDEFDEVEEIEEIEEPTEETEQSPAEEAKSYEEPPVEREQRKVRSLTREEKELYGPFIQSRSAREQLVKAVDGISMASYTGNIIVTGEAGMDTMTLAKNMIREVQMTDSNFSGKVAKISGNGLNQRNVEDLLNPLNNGALIIQKASGMNAETVAALYKVLQQETLGIIVVLEDTKKAINKLLAENPKLTGCFTSRMDVEALSNDALVAFGRQYAREQEFSIDELGILALHTRIEELQTIDHVVTVIDVKEIVDEAIDHASRKTLGHFFDVLFGKRYDDEDMIILNEKDFV